MLNSIVLLFILFSVAGIIKLMVDQEDNKTLFKKNNEKQSLKKYYSDRMILKKLKTIKPNEFENYIAYLFKKLGFKTEVVGKSHDGGIDVVATKDGIKHYIQCKKYITSQVTLADVRDFYGALVDHLANGKGYFITTNKFTLEAEKFMEDKPVELIDGFRLLHYIKLAGIRNDNINDIININLRCPKCGAILIRKKGKYNNQDFYACPNYPKCKYTQKISNEQYY